MPELSFCPAVSRKGWHCETAVHPGHVHYTWRNGWLTAWMALPGEDERWRNQLSTDGVLDEAPTSLVAGMPFSTDPGVPPGQIELRDAETGAVLSVISIEGLPEPLKKSSTEGRS